MNGNDQEPKAPRLSRRSLVRRTLGAGAALAMPAIIPSRAWGAGGVAPSERITLGVIGYGPRCEHVLGAFLGEPDVQCVAVADVQASKRNKCKSVVDSKNGNSDCKMYRDFREMLARPDIDAVVIATGDRWHTPASVFAARAGKDIYCEKPCAMTIAECQLLAETMRRYGRVFQAGTQRRSIRNFEIARDLAVGGKLGRIKTLHASLVLPGVGFDWLPGEPEPPKDVVDWDLWVGPCPMRPYNRQYVAGGWRAHNDFNAGYNIMEWGAHTVDLCQWARGGDEAQPVSYEGDGLNINATYADGAVLVMEGLKTPFGDRSPQFQTRLGTCPVKYVGEQGWVETGDSGDIDAGPVSLKTDVQKLVTARRRAGTDAGSHVRNFLDCVKSRERSHSNADVTRRSHVAGHAAAISWFLKRKVTLDPQTESFISDDEANRLRARAYREPWCL